MKRILFCLLFLPTFSLSLLAQTKETLNNKAIVDLYKAGLAKETIIAKIEATECKFDLNTTALINLKKANLPDEILTAMMEKTSLSSESNSGKKPASNQKPSTPAAGAVPEPDFMNVPQYYNKTAYSLTPLERSTVAVKAKVKFGSFFPGGNTPIVFKLNGPASPVRLPNQESMSFLINTGQALPDNFGLYRMKSGKKDREATWLNVSAFDNKSDKDVISFNYKKVKDGVYEIVPVQKLEKGEYSFVNKASYNTYAGAKADVFAFGVE